MIPNILTQFWSFASFFGKLCEKCVTYHLLTPGELINNECLIVIIARIKEFISKKHLHFCVASKTLVEGQFNTDAFYEYISFAFLLL